MGRQRYETDTVSSAVNRFYDRNPFPYYELSDYPTFDDLKKDASAYVRRLDQNIGSRARILDAGCGTGLLSNYLAHIPTRTLVGLDFSAESLNLAESLRRQMRSRNLRFVQGDLFRPPFGKSQFDVVICHGVLHHTADPEGGFRVLCDRLAPGGSIAVGLYHLLGRRRHWKRIKSGDDGSGDRRTPAVYPRDERPRPDRTFSSWEADQCQHPHESGHLLAGAARWFRKNDLVVTGRIPTIGQGADALGGRPFFERSDRRSWKTSTLFLLLVDLWLWKKSPENGYYVIFGRKKDDARAGHRD